MNGFKDEQLIQDLTHTERLESKKPIYRQRFPANIKQIHINVRKKTEEEKRIKYEKLIKETNKSNSITKSNISLNNDIIHTIPNNNTINYTNENISRKKLFRTKRSYFTISLIHFSSLLKGEPSNQISTYSFEKNEYIKEEDIIPLNLFLKTSLSNYQGPIPKPNNKIFYQMYGIFMQGLKSQNKEVRFESMNGIAKLDCIEMVPSCEKIWFNSLLNQVITEGNNDDKWNICTMLCRHGIQSTLVIDYLQTILGDTDVSKRKYVVYLLSKVSEKNITNLTKNIIYNKLKDANWRVRIDSIRVLQKLLRRMLKYIPETDLYIDIDKENIQKKGEDFSIVDEITNLINKDKKLNEKSSKSKNEIKDIIEEKDSYLVNKALQIVMNVMWYDWKLDVRNAASRLLMKIGKGKPIYSWIIMMISSDNPMKKINGLKCIGYLNVITNDAIDPFLKCFDDIFTSVRIEACKVAYILELNYPPLIQKLANCFDDNSWEVRAFAVKAMSRCRCKSNLINDTILWNLVHETNHRVLFETIKVVKKLNLINNNNKIKEALFLLSEDKNESIADLAKRILYDNGILFEKKKNIDFTSPEDLNKESSQKEINILYNTRPPFNFACDGLDMIKHEVNLLTMKEFITSEIIKQEKKYKNHNRNENMKQYNQLSNDNITSYRKPNIDKIYNDHSHQQSNNNKNNKNLNIENNKNNENINFNIINNKNIDIKNNNEIMENNVEPTTEAINNNADITEEKIYKEDVPANVNTSYNNESSTKPLSTLSKYPPPNLIDSLPNQIIKDEVLKGEFQKETTTDFDLCDMFDDVEENIEKKLNNLNKINEKKEESKSIFLESNDIDLKTNDLNYNYDSNNNTLIDSIGKRSSIPIKHSRIANIEDHTTYTKSLIRVFHKTESITESINCIENNNRFKGRLNKSKRSLSNTREHSTFISEKSIKESLEENLMEKNNSLNEIKGSIDKSKCNSLPDLNTGNDLNIEKSRDQHKDKKVKKKATFALDNEIKEDEKKKRGFSSSLDLLLYKSHENLGFIDKIMLQKMNNAYKKTNVISSREFKKQNDVYNENEERYYYPIEFTDNVEGRKLYYEYKTRKSMRSEPLIIHRRNLLFSICLLLTLILFGLLIYDYYSLIIKEKNSIFFGWINAIYILSVINMAIALLTYIYANESGKILFTVCSIILGLLTIVVFILRFIFTWTTKNLIPIDYK
ncbi:ARM repeat-containing protein [Piromyces finnis]|uniref:ARM repeat-containing protein n=1 Tax=Piromyces finnis TaxID=1754191 RepID=A0A1Y1V1R4_9FUNG|nr:ARM repeat-containing protein [Piromyces finnis]|eukprot:ORX45154.1 ARM repeat-containing protein [Piromyces finnis]